MPVDVGVPSRFGRDARTILQLGGPLLVNNLVLAGMGVANTMAAGRLGPEPLAGVAVGVAYYQIFFLAGLGVLLSMPALVAHSYGARRDSEVGHRFRQGLWLSQLLALPLLGALLLVAPALAWFGTDPNTVPHALDYVYTLCFGLPAMLAFLVHRYTTEGIGWTKPIMWVAALGLVANVIGNWEFTLGNLGAPSMGARGCGLATVLAQWTMLIALHLYQRRHPIYAPLQLFRREGPSLPALREILALGLPVGGSVVSEGALFAVAALMVSKLGAAVVAAHQVALTWASLMFMVPLALHSATTVHVGHRLGASDPTGGRFAGWSGVLLCAGFMVLAAFLTLLGRGLIPLMFTPDAQVAGLASGLLLYAALFHVPDGIQVGAAGALRGYKDARVPMLLNFTAYWLVGFPVAWWAGIRLGWGVDGVWAGLIIGLFTCAVLLSLRYGLVSRRYRRQGATP